MKRVLIYTMIATVTFAAAGGSTMFLLKKADDKKINQTQEVEDEEYEEVPPSNQSLFINNLIDGNLDVKNLDVVAYNLEEGKDLAVNFKGTFDYKGLELAKTNFENFKLQGVINAKYSGIDESLKVTFLPGKKSEDNALNGLNNGTCYFTYKDKDFNFKVQTIFDIVNVLEVFDIPVQNMFEKTAAVKFGAKTPKGLDPMALLNEIKETETEYGFDYSLTIPSIGTVILESTKDNLLSGIRTDGRLNIGGQELALNAEIISKTESAFDTNMTPGQSLDHIPFIIKEIGKIYNSNHIRSGFNIKFRNENEVNNVDIDLDGEISLDFSNSGKEKFADLNKTDLLEGKYAFSINPVGTINGTNQVNTLKALYSDNDVYFKLNNLFKGKLPDATIQDLIKTGSEQIEVPQLNGALEKIGKFFENSEIMNIINGDYVAVKNILKDITITNSKISLTLNSSSFNFEEGEIKIVINFDNNLKVKSLSLSGLHYQTYYLDFELSLLNFLPLNNYFESLENFKDYTGAIGIYETVSELINSKTIAADYKISLLNNDPAKNYELLGSLSGDFKDVDFNNLDSFDKGTYSLFVDTSIFGHRRTLDANYLDGESYFNYNDLITNKIENATIVDMYKVLDNLLTKENTDDTSTSPSEAVAATSSVLDEITTKYQPLLDEIKKGNLVALEDYITIDEDNIDKDILDLKISPNGDQRYSIIIKLSNLDNKLEQIEVQGVEINDFVLNFALNLNNFEPITVDKTIYAPIDNLLYGAQNFINRPVFNTSLNATITEYLAPGEEHVVPTNAPDIKDDINLSAKAYVDIKTENYYGSLDISTQLPVDQNIKHHRFLFDHAKTEDGLDHELLAKYCTVNGETESPTSMLINMHQNKMFSLVRNIQDVPETNVVWKLLQIVKEARVLLPIEEIINGKYEMIFDDYLQNFQITESVTEDSRSQVLNVVVDGKLIGVEGDLEINLYIDALNNDLTHVEIVDLRLANKIANVIFTVDEPDPSLEATRLRNITPKVVESDGSCNYVDFDSLDLLFKVGINTTNTANYHLKGNFNLDVPDIADCNLGFVAPKIADLYYSIDIRIHVTDKGKVEGYINLAQQKDTNYIQGINTKIALMDNDDAIIYQYRKEWGKTGDWKHPNDYIPYEEIFRVSQQEMMDNFMYYFLKYVLRFSDFLYDTIADSVNDGPKDPTKVNPIFKFDYPSIIDGKSVKHIIDEENVKNQRFEATFNLDKVLDLGAVTKNFVKADKLNVKVGYAKDPYDNTEKLSYIHLSTPKLVYIDLQLAILPTLDISLDFYVTNQLFGGNVLDLTPRDDLLNLYENRATNKNLAKWHADTKTLENCNKLR